jgi:hypothetical protein
MISWERSWLLHLNYPLNTITTHHTRARARHQMDRADCVLIVKWQQCGRVECFGLDVHGERTVRDVRKRLAVREPLTQSRRAVDNGVCFEKQKQNPELALRGRDRAASRFADAQWRAAAG